MVIAAAPEALFPLVNDFHQWEGWSPWAKLDPAMKVVYDGPASGVGAVYKWTGDSKVGEGRMTLIESQPVSVIRINLEFLKPMESTSITQFAFKPEGKGTSVTWTMSGKNNFVGKAFCLFASMDKMVGPDFEKGLAQMKSLAEGKK